MPHHPLDIPHAALAALPKVRSATETPIPDPYAKDLETLRAKQHPTPTPTASMNFEVENASGRICCQSDEFDSLCDKCKATVRATPPDAYAEGIAALRAAAGYAQPENISTELASMEAFRLKVYETAITSRLAANNPAVTRRHLEAPDSYERDLQKMREGRR